MYKNFQVLVDADLTGKTCLITGGSSGIGLEITKCLLSKNCNMLVAVRNPYAINNAWNSLNKINDNGTLKVYGVNLTSLKSVKQCVDKLLEEQRFVLLFFVIIPIVVNILSNYRVLPSRDSHLEDPFEIVDQLYHLVDESVILEGSPK